MTKNAKAGIVIGLLIAIVLVGLTVANWRFASSSPGGNDFIPRWLGTRLLITEGLNPYGSETSQLIQEFVYGRAANPGEDQQLFAYPLHAIFVFAPFGLIGDYEVVRALWMTTLEISLVVMAIIGLRLTGAGMSPLILGGVALFGLLWYHSVRPLVNGNPSIISALFLAVSYYALRGNKDILAGLLLALATIKPQIIVLVIPLVLLWSLSHKRWQVLASFFISLLIILLISLILEPDWISQNLNQIRLYPEYTLPGTPRKIIEAWWPVGAPYLAILIAIGTGLLMLWMWNVTWQAPFDVLIWAIFGTLAITNLIGIQTAVSNYVAMLPAVVFVIAAISTRGGQRGKWLAVLLIALSSLGLWALFFATQEGRDQSGIMFFPIPILLLVTLILLRPKTKGLINLVPS